MLTKIESAKNSGHYLETSSSHARENWLHVWSKEAGPKIAEIFSVVESCCKLRRSFASISPTAPARSWPPLRLPPSPHKWQSNLSRPGWTGQHGFAGTAALFCYAQGPPPLPRNSAALSPPLAHFSSASTAAYTYSTSCRFRPIRTLFTMTTLWLIKS